MCFLNSSFICVSTGEKQPQKRRTFMCIVKFCVLRTIHVCLQISLKCTSSFFECTCIPWFPTERIALTKSSCVATSREAFPLSQFVRLGGRPTLTWRTCIEFISVFSAACLHAETSGCRRSCPQDGGQVVVPSHGQGVDGEGNGSIWYNTSDYSWSGSNITFF